MRPTHRRPLRVLRRHLGAYSQRLIVRMLGRAATSRAHSQAGPECVLNLEQFAAASGTEAITC